jgi:hypothetical protein
MEDQMADSTSYSEKLKQTKRAHVTATDAAVNEAQALPEYKAYEAAVIYSERVMKDYVNPSHPSWDVDRQSQETHRADNLQKIADAKESLKTRLAQDGIEALMPELERTAHQAANEATARRY